MAQIFDYMDYRQYLRDFFEEKKRELRFYSYRLFSKRAGLKSPNFLKLVINGDRNLSKESVYKFSKALNLSKKEVEYFENLIFFNQSKSLDEKNYYLAKILKYRSKSDPRKIEEEEYEYYSRWYNLVIRELVCAADFRDDFGKLGASLIPAITAKEAAKAVELLLQLGFIERAPEGLYRKTAASLSTGPKVRSVAIANYHKAMLLLAGEAIDRFSPEERDISSLTLGVSEKTYRAIDERLQQFRRELLEMAEEDEIAERVVQLNLYLFPLSRILKKKEGTS